MQKKISIGIDIGTQNTRIIVLGDEGNNVPKVISSYSSVSRGLRHGYITKTKDASQSVREAFKNIEKMFVGTKLPRFVYQLEVPDFQEIFSNLLFLSSRVKWK